MSDWIRVSCAALCRIEHAGRFLLLLNANRCQKGLYQLGPVGGALQWYDASCLTAWGAIPEDATLDELRLMLPQASLGAFRSWFYRREARERSPFRELQEELVTEAGLLPALTPEDVDYRYLWTVEKEAFTDRQGQTGLLTHYFLEVYAITFKTHVALSTLLSVSPSSGAVWLTVEQITQQATITLPIDGKSRAVYVRGASLLRPPQPDEETQA